MQLCGFTVGPDQPFFLIAGPCVIESEQLALDTAGQLKEITARLGIPFTDILHQYFAEVHLVDLNTIDFFRDEGR